MEPAGRKKALYTELSVFLTGFPLLYCCAFLSYLIDEVLTSRVDGSTANFDLLGMFPAPFLLLVVVHIAVLYWLAGWFFRLCYRKMPRVFWLVTAAIITAGCYYFIRSYAPARGNWRGEPGYFSAEKTGNLTGLLLISFGFYLTVTTLLFRSHFRRSGALLELV